ncbi:MAG: hypothetical protein K2P81_05435 [Bacteriovoracaceae bacterium]|nr:hypothetical protein [Bacteriovoracaceae bacterium]
MLPARLESILRKLNHPYKIQEWVSRFPYNSGDETRSALEAFKAKKAHCFEGALLACLALEYNGQAPLMMDLRGHGDDDHVVALYKLKGKWGAISKTNTTVLDFRPAFFRDPRELAMSYWAMYFNWKGRYAMKDFAGPIDLRKYKKFDWRYGKEDMIDLGLQFNKLKHTTLSSPRELSHLPRAPERLRQACFLGSDLKGVRKS